MKQIIKTLVVGGLAVLLTACGGGGGNSVRQVTTLPSGATQIELLDGRVMEGPMVDGERHGQWTTTFPSGMVAEGPYVNGKQHGQWTFTFPNGIVIEIQYVNGVLQN